MNETSSQLQQYEDIVKKITEDVEINSTSLTSLFKYWFNFFYEKIIRIFEYDNLPFPFQELEGTCMISGKNFMAYDNKYGFVTRNGSIYGVTPYPDVFTHVLYVMPNVGGTGTISGKKKIGVDAVVLYNTATSLSFVPFLNRYASLATHFDLTLKSLLIDVRYPDAFTTSDENSRDSINEYFNLKYDGKAGVILDETLFTATTGTINLNANKHPSSDVRTIIDSQNELLRNFYRDIGLRWIKDKRANVISDEVEGNDAVLLFNISDMLYQRQKFVDECNRVFKNKLTAPITVKLNSSFIQEGSENSEKNNV